MENTGNVKGWLSLFIAQLFFGGIIALIQGLILESSSDVLLDIKGKPTFFVIDRSKDQYLKKILCD